MTTNYTLGLRLSRKEFAYRTGVSFRGLTISQSGTGYNVVIRARTVDGTPVYALVQHNDPVAALEILVQSVMGRKGTSLWYPDRYAKSNGDS